MTATSPQRAIPREEVSRRVLARLLERFEAGKTKHKPLSLLRPEIRRAAEQMLEQELATGEIDDAEQLLETILDEVPCMNPLEELFRDEKVQEFLIVAPQLVIVRSGDGWLPTPVQFRDNDHCRTIVKKLLQMAEPIGDVPRTSDGGADARLANGFRIIAILPPRALDLCPQAVFRRPIAAPADVTPPPRSGTVQLAPPRASGVASLTSRTPDPWERTKQRVMDLFAERLAANGVSDLGGLPVGELRKIIASYVLEFNELEKLHLDAAAQDRMTLEILAGMNRDSSARK